MSPRLERPPPKILLIEDDPAVLSLLGDVLAASGFLVSRFESPFQALAAIRREAPSAVVLDWHLPETSGRAVIDRMRAQLGWLPPVLVVTGDVRLPPPPEVAEVLRKPVSLAHFVERVRALVPDPSSGQPAHGPRRTGSV